MGSLSSSYTLTVLCCLILVSATQDCNDQRIIGLLKDPPPGWDVNSLSKEDVKDFVCSRTLISSAVDCLEISFSCDEKVPGLGALVETLYDLIDQRDNRALIDRKVLSLLIGSASEVERNHPDDYLRALKFFSFN